ncbi:MAG: gliding motility lipoprotein GldH [Bacteroidales bacterium]|nr:MAG: gliding motility lipoprotein GldH [Bacteroidales bacterium]
MLQNRFIIVLFSAIFLVSCDRNGVFEENIDTPNTTWTKENVAKFIATISDTISYHNIFINIRNTTDYTNCNLYLFIATTSPSGAAHLDTIECLLADDQGKWLGKGFGYIRDSQIPYKFSVRFPQTGDYKFEIKQAMRTDSLGGISSVGVRVERR